jgi:Flp pilus assembly protein TadD
LGTIREKIGGERLELALQDFNKVISIDPNYAPSYNGRGLVKDRFQQMDEAIKDFSQAIAIDPQNPVYLHNRGCCYRNIGNLEKSI